MRTLLDDLLSLLRCHRNAIIAFACITLMNIASPAQADFATSGRLRANPHRATKPIFHGGAQQSEATDPFLDAQLHTPPENREPVAVNAGVQSQENAAAGQQAAQDWIHPSVVRVRVEEKDGLANGSGTLIGVDDKHGYVITNWHVVQGASGQIAIEFPDGFRSAATVMKMDEEWDLAILVIWKPHALPMPLSARLPSPGEPLIIAGYGQGKFRSAKGAMTEFVAPTTDSPFEMFEVSTAARQGDSGGPIVNMQGELTGVLFGAGDGRTTGSHVGRLREFLAEAFRPPAPEPANAGPEMVAQNAPPDPSTRPAQQPAAFHQTEGEMNALAREVAAGLPGDQQIPGGDVAVQIPNEAPTQLMAARHNVATLPGAAPNGLSQVVGAEVSDDLLAGIPVAKPYEYRRMMGGAQGGASGGTYGGLSTANSRGGNAFADLKMFFTLFGAFAVVFLLLPRNRD